MKITVPAGKLKALLDDVLQLGIGDATHPGFRLTRFEVSKKGMVRATVVNARAGVRKGFVADVEDFAPGVLALGLTSLASVRDVLPSDDTPVAIGIKEKPGAATIMSMRYGDKLMKFPTHSVSDLIEFPSPPDGVEMRWLPVAGDQLQAIVRHCSQFCAPESDARVNLQGVHMTPAYVEAADGHRLIKLDMPGLVHERVIVPKAMITSMAKYAGAGAIQMATTPGRVWARSADFMLTCRLNDGVYPDTSSMYVDDNSDGMVLSNRGVKRQCSEVQISLPALWSAASDMTKVFGSRGKDNRPVLRFQLKAANELTVYMRSSESGDDTGVDMAQKVACAPGERFAVTEEACEQLNAMLIDAEFVSQVSGSLPKQDTVNMIWVTALDRVQLRSGIVTAIVMPRTP